MKKIIICKNCNREKPHSSKGLCVTCYKKLFWKPRKFICKRCKKEKPHHAKGLCNNCYNILFKYDSIKSHNFKKWHNISLETHREITKKCVICGFDKIVELHHLDHNHENISSENLIGLCPNHHRMIHMHKFKDEVRKQIYTHISQDQIKKVKSPLDRL